MNHVRQYCHSQYGSYDTPPSPVVKRPQNILEIRIQKTPLTFVLKYNLYLCKKHERITIIITLNLPSLAGFLLSIPYST